MDSRLMGALQSNTFSQTPVDQAAANDAFNIPNSTSPNPADTDLDGMPDSWENYHGLNPIVQDHNGLNLSVQLTGVAGYTNLECYLNCLSDFLITGIDQCGLTSAVSQHFDLNQISIHPNPAKESIRIDCKWNVPLHLELINILGEQVLTVKLDAQQTIIPIEFLATGLYTALFKNEEGHVIHSAMLNKQ